VGGPELRRIQGAYVMPLETQFYIGFYNKALFKKAGITTCHRLDPAPADCKLLKAKASTMVYGNGGQAISTEFYPWYDMSYLMIGRTRWRVGRICTTDPSVDVVDQRRSAQDVAHSRRMVTRTPTS